MPVTFIQFVHLSFIFLKTERWVIPFESLVLLSLFRHFSSLAGPAAGLSICLSQICIWWVVWMCFVLEALCFIPADCSFYNANGRRLVLGFPPLSAGHCHRERRLMGLTAHGAELIQSGIWYVGLGWCHTMDILVAFMSQAYLMLVSSSPGCITMENGLDGTLHPSGEIH